MLPSVGKKSQKLNFPLADKIQERAILKEAAELKERSKKRQEKSTSFTLIKELKENYKGIKENDSWLFNDLTTLNLAKQEIEKFNQAKKTTKTNNKLQLLEEEGNESGKKFFPLINTDPVAGESMNILKDYTTP